MVVGCELLTAGCVCTVEMDEYVYQYLCPSAIQTVLEDEDSFPPLNKKVRTALLKTRFQLGPRVLDLNALAFSAACD